MSQFGLDIVTIFFEYINEILVDLFYMPIDFRMIKSSLSKINFKSYKQVFYHLIQKIFFSITNEDFLISKNNLLVKEFDILLNIFGFNCLCFNPLSQVFDCYYYMFHLTNKIGMNLCNIINFLFFKRN